ncbi:hypothetical protein FRB95_003673 [Tulasnella sp. JGI-2019a]|nr:hypothetical protein FRB95_003673 [Tulasnella sp. JGI-2019a]
MESNKDEALRCLQIFLTHLTSAIKFAKKSVALYSTPAAIALADQLNKALEQQTSSSSAGDASGFENGSNSKSGGAKQHTADHHNESAQRDHHTCHSTVYYDILGLEKECDERDVKEAFHKLALLLHPDKNPAPRAGEAFKLVSKAFEALSDPQERAAYDANQDFYPEQCERGFEPGMRDTFTGPDRGGYYSSDRLSPQDLFNMYFDRVGGSGLTQPGGWWFGTRPDGIIGLFPANYVEVIEEAAEPKLETVPLLTPSPAPPPPSFTPGKPAQKDFAPPPPPLVAPGKPAQKQFTPPPPPPPVTPGKPTQKDFIPPPPPPPVAPRKPAQRTPPPPPPPVKLGQRKAAPPPPPPPVKLGQRKAAPPPPPPPPVKPSRRKAPPPPPPTRAAAAPAKVDEGIVVIAIFDFSACDDDEISFNESEKIIHVTGFGGFGGRVLRQQVLGASFQVGNAVLNTFEAITDIPFVPQRIMSRSEGRADMPTYLCSR